MNSKSARNAALLLVGTVVGIVCVQLLWPLVVEAQRPEQPGPPSWVVQGQMPTIERQVRAFRAVEPDLPPARLQEISRGLGMTGQPTTNQGVLTLDEGSRSLRIMPDTGAMSYRNNGAMGDGGQRNLPNAGQAGAAADRFLRDNDLLPQAGSRSSVEVIGVLRQNSEGGPTSTMQNEIQVNYGFRLGGKRVEGPGAKATVFIGEGGDVVGFDKAWREVTEERMVTTRTADQALGQLRQKGLWNMLRQAGGPVREIRVTQVRAGYWADDLGQDQDLIEPAFIFEGRMVREDGVQVPFMQKVSAVADETEASVPSSPAQPTRPPE